MTFDSLVGGLMIVLAVAAIVAAVRVPMRGLAGRSAAGGYWLFAVGALLQAVNHFMDGYSVALAVIATLGLVLGLVQISRGWSRRDALV